MSGRDHRLPTFLVIGAMKAGTTTLYQRLARHPDVFMPENKEPDFFVAEKTWDRGLDWYRGLFEGAGGAVAVGEASTSYSKCTEFDGVPRRIATVLPDVRLVYVLREPIGRMRSMYLHNVRMGRERTSADEALLERPMYLDASRYALQMDAFLEHFDRDRLYVLRTEDLRTDAQGAVAGVLRFLGLDPDRPVHVDRDYNTAAQRRRETGLSRRLRALPAFETALRLTPDRLKRRLYQATTRPVATEDLQKAEVRPQTLAELQRRLRPDLLRLRGHLGGDFDAWGLLD